MSMKISRRNLFSLWVGVVAVVVACCLIDELGELVGLIFTFVLSVGFYVFLFLPGFTLAFYGNFF